MKTEKITLSLLDEEWELEYIDHDREIARAVVFDDEKNLYFVRVERNDDFGKGTFIETAGGGVEKGETPLDAITRELYEELGAEVEVLCEIGEVSDYYNLIHRHNINHYFLCKVKSFGNTHLMPDEMDRFRLSTMKLSFEEAVEEYERGRTHRWGRLLANRELPIIMYANEQIQSVDKVNDWRLAGQEKYMGGCTLKEHSVGNLKNRPNEWHEHCEFCMDKIDKKSNNAVYSTEDEYRWVCTNCFDDLKEYMSFKIKS